MPAVHLTDLAIKNLPLPPAGQVTYTDETLPGFGVRVSPAGVRAFVLVHGPNRTRTTLGRYPVITLQQARAKAKSVLAERTLGKFQKATVKFDAALDLYIQNHLEKLKPKTTYDTKRLLNKHFRPKLQHERLADVSRGAIAAITNRLVSTPSEARHAHTAITGFFRWATDQFLEQNPVLGLKPPAKQGKRSYVLSPAELQTVYVHARTQADAYGKIVRLLILTGQRLKQITHLRGEFVDRRKKLIEWPPELMKSNRRHVIPYGKLADDIIATLPQMGLCFPGRGEGESPLGGFSKLKEQFDAACDVSGYTHHDFRRTMRTALAELKGPREHAERLLDHRSATMSEVEAIYDRFHYLGEMRDAVEAWESHLSHLLKRKRGSKRGSKVLALSSRL
jgi:integrase